MTFRFSKVVFFFFFLFVSAETSCINLVMTKCVIQFAWFVPFFLHKACYKVKVKILKGFYFSCFIGVVLEFERVCRIQRTVKQLFA